MTRFQLGAGPILIAMLLASPQVSADPVLYSADKWHTRIFFTVNHQGLSNFQGRFKDYDVTFMFDEEDMANSSVEVTIPVRSIDTFSPELNSKMPDEGFFAAADHPAILFRSTEIVQVDADTAIMIGDLTIKNITLPIEFDVTFNKNGLHPRFGINNAGFTATAKVDSRAYGVNPLPEAMIPSMVDIRVELEAFEGDKVPYYDE